MFVLGGARDAAAFVPYVNSTGRTLALPICLPVSIIVYPGTFSQMTIEEGTGAVTAAAAAWSAAANP